ncbi:MAG: 4'-phosphopantetheinyl transferase superfamily protein [Anaerolineales bacterium]
MPVDEIHVWQVSVSDVLSSLEEFWQVLDQAEKQKVERLRTNTDKNRAIVSHGFLRTLLGWYLGQDPLSIEFSYGLQGKPAILGAELEFNVTHSGDLILYAFASDCPVGIDVECISHISELQDLVNRFFSPDEQHRLASLSVSEQERAFFKLWTLREAYGKMKGGGLVDVIKDVDILYFLTNHAHSTFETFAPLPHYVAALVVDGCGRKVVHFDGFPGHTS